MKKLDFIAALMALATLSSVLPAESAGESRSPAAERCYELRTYHTFPGKLDALHARFRDHTMKLFEKHGMQNVGYWVPIEKDKGSENTLIYVLGYPSHDARDRAWKAFGADPEWRKAFRESTRDGRLVEKVESVVMSPADYSPEVIVSKRDNPRLFELRVYKATPGNLDNLNARFRNHTFDLFTKHGMSQLGYWTPVAGQPGAGETLIYILAHKDRAARDASFDAFRNDPQWISAKKASEVNGSLTERVDSTLMKATDYSPMK